MTRLFCLGLLCLAPLALQGCIAKTAFDIATAPVRAAGQVADWATTSQDEADRNRGRDLREREERFGKLERRYRDQREDCDRGDERACAESRETWAEMEELRPTIPIEPED